MFVFFSCKNEDLNHDYLNGYWLVKPEKNKRNDRYHTIMHFKEDRIDYYYDFEGLINDVNFKIIEDSMSLFNKKGETYSSWKCEIKGVDTCFFLANQSIDTLIRIDKLDAQTRILEMAEGTEIEVAPPIKYKGED